jgi:hypothetical protein
MTALWANSTCGHVAPALSLVVVAVVHLIAAVVALGVVVYVGVLVAVVASAVSVEGVVAPVYVGC